ncbi:DEAD/DEAH box helicase family protein, partial [Streptomyces sp. NPDC089922]
LAPYAAPPHSWEAFVQDELNGMVSPSRVARPVPLRDYQRELVRGPVEAQRVGAPGYIWVLPTGSGKTPLAIRGAEAMLTRNARRILVVTKLSVIPAWRAAISRFATSTHRWVVTNPERLWRLLDHPRVNLDAMPVEDAARLAAAEGHSRVEWDVIIVDECHMLVNADARRSRIVRRLQQRPDGGRTFTLWASATPFSTPLESAYAADLIAYAAKVDPPPEGADYRLWLMDLGLKLNADRSGRWYQRLNRLDVTTLRSLLYEGGVGAAATVSELNLPVQQRDVLPLELSAQDRASYDLSWQEFRRSEGLTVFEGSEPGSYRVAALRRVQKASLVKAPYVARLVVEQVRQGRQVVVPMWFRESIDKVAVHIARALKAAGLNQQVVAITGREP